MGRSSTETDTLLDDVLRRLIEASAASGSVTLDEIAEAIGAAAVSYEDVEHLIMRLELAGRHIVEPVIDLTTDLRRVIAAARALSSRLGRPPRVSEIAVEAELSEAAVITALHFARTFG